MLREDSVDWCWETSDVLETGNGICSDFLLLWLFYVGFCIHEGKVGCIRFCYVTNAKIKKNDLQVGKYYSSC